MAYLSIENKKLHESTLELKGQLEKEQEKGHKLAGDVEAALKDNSTLKWDMETGVAGMSYFASASRPVSTLKLFHSTESSARTYNSDRGRAEGGAAEAAGRRRRDTGRAARVSRTFHRSQPAGRFCGAVPSDLEGNANKQASDPPPTHASNTGAKSETRTYITAVHEE